MSSKLQSLFEVIDALIIKVQLSDQRRKCCNAVLGQVFCDVLFVYKNVLVYIKNESFVPVIVKYLVAQSKIYRRPKVTLHCLYRTFSEYL